MRKEYLVRNTHALFTGRRIRLFAGITAAVILTSCGHKTDYSSPQAAFNTSLHAAKNNLTETYLDSLILKQRLTYGNNREEQISNLKMKNLKSEDKGALINGVLYTTDKKAALIIVSLIFDGHVDDREAGAIMLQEDGKWRLGLLMPFIKLEFVEEFQTRNTAWVNQFVEGMIDVNSVLGEGAKAVRALDGLN